MKYEYNEEDSKTITMTGFQIIHFLLSVLYTQNKDFFLHATFFNHSCELINVLWLSDLIGLLTGVE